MDKERFAEACQAVIGREHKRTSIGTLSEKTLHAVLKHYYEPHTENHEIKIGSYVADIADAHGIIEIQTRSFDKLRNKLEYFLQTTPVTVVYPVAHTKWITWTDTETGEISGKRKSPKTGSPYEVFFELYKIKSLLLHDNLHLHIMLLDVEEYRNLDGWSKDRKRGSSRYERIPVDLVRVVCIDHKNDYGKLIPPSLPERFTVKDFQKASKLSRKKAGTALNILHYVGSVIRVGRKGNAYIYEQAQGEEPKVGLEKEAECVK